LAYVRCACSVGQELQQFAEQLLGSLFRNVVAAWKCVTPHVACEAPPLLQRAEAFFDCAVRGPQREHVALDLAARREVRALVIQIDAGEARNREERFNWSLAFARVFFSCLQMEKTTSCCKTNYDDGNDVLHEARLFGRIRAIQPRAGDGRNSFALSDQVPGSTSCLPVPAKCTKGR
jgi:hypothetical protein